jgi:flagellar assembly factor FliW
MAEMTAEITGQSMRLLTPWLGEISWEEACELHFPAGLPGFEQYRRLVPIEIPSQRPLVYLQSAEQGGICFLALPALAIYPGFQLRLSEDDLSLLEFDVQGSSQVQSPALGPVLGTDVLCLALLRPFGNTVETNLDAPIVINLHNSRGIQAISPLNAARSWRLTQDGNWAAVC